MKTILKEKTIFFDMDGTLVDLYRDKNWLERIINEDASLYAEAKPLINVKKFSRLAKILRNKGYKIGIISQLPWDASKKYQLEVKKVKEEYINNIFSDIEFDKIHIVPSTTPKHIFASKGDYLVDDDKKNRKAWKKGKALTELNLLKKLEKLV